MRITSGEVLEFKSIRFLEKDIDEYTDKEFDLEIARLRGQREQIMLKASEPRTPKVPKEKVISAAKQALLNTPTEDC